MPAVKTVSPLSVLARFVATYAPGKYVADMVAPPVRLDAETAVIPKHRRQDLGDKEDYRVAPGATPNRIRTSFDTVSISQESYAAIAEIPQEVLDANQLSVDLVASELAKARNKILADRERRLATVLDDSANYDASSAVTNAWSDRTNGTPLDDLYTALEALPAAAPGTKTVLLLTTEGWHALAKHPQLRGNGAVRSVLAKAEVLSLFDGMLDDILVSGARVRTTKRGATPSYSRIFDKTKARVLRIPANPNAKELQAHTMTFRRNLGPGGWYLERWRDPEPGRSGTVKVKVALAEVISTIQADQGYLLTGIL